MFQRTSSTERPARRVGSKTLSPLQHRFRVIKPTSHAESKSLRKKACGKRPAAAEPRKFDVSICAASNLRDNIFISGVTDSLGDDSDGSEGFFETAPVATTVSQKQPTSNPQQSFYFVFENPTPSTQNISACEDPTPSGKTNVQNTGDQWKNGIALCNKLIAEYKLQQYADELKIPLYESIADSILPPKWELLFENKRTPEFGNKFVMFVKNFRKDHRSKAMANRHQERVSCDQREIIRLAAKSWREESAVRAFWELLFQCRIKVYRVLFPDRIYAASTETSDDVCASLHFETNGSLEISEDTSAWYNGLDAPFLLKEDDVNEPLWFDTDTYKISSWFTSEEYNNTTAQWWSNDETEPSEKCNNSTEKEIPFWLGD